MGKYEVKVDFDDLMTMIAVLKCENLHHRRSEYHKSDEVCPVVKRLRDRYWPQPTPEPKVECDARAKAEYFSVGGSDF